MMPMMFIAALMMAQAPTAVSPTAPVPPIEIKGKKKPRQKCEYIEVTGSRTRQHVCRDQFGDLDLGPGVSNAAANPGMMHSIPGAAKGGVGGTPQ
jgi:hypothetical protein